MCGIVGAISNNNVTDFLLKGLAGLEYRGYDSAGIAIIDEHHQLDRLRTLGKIVNLTELVKKECIEGRIGIAHTRWATHGAPSVTNAHPHFAGESIAIVHNGIIENHQTLRQELINQGCTIESETDSELIAHLIHLSIKKGCSSFDAIRNLTSKLNGAYAIAILIKNDPDHLYAIRMHSSLVIGLSETANFIASDPLVLNEADKLIFLEDGDIADITLNEVEIFNQAGEKLHRETTAINHEKLSVDKGKYEHFMLKEIYEQPQAIAATLEGRMTEDEVFPEIFGYTAKEIFSKVSRVKIVACGTSYHAGLVAKFWLESIANIPCHVEIASEFRYRDQPVESSTLFVTLSQSGETADTLAALRLAKTKEYLATLTICNVANSTLVRESDLCLMTNAGPEIGVASTKAFTTQLVSLMMLTISIYTSNKAPTQEMKELLHELFKLPTTINSILKHNAEISTIASHLINFQNALYIGRGIEFPIALEGALKLKEISYIHAEAVPAGELKHGTLALVDMNMPVVALAPNNQFYDKISANLEVVRARGGNIIVLTDDTTLSENQQLALIPMPTCHYALSPILYVIPLQLLAYYAAVLKGNDVDQPRNLAKSVTVE